MRFIYSEEEKCQRWKTEKAKGKKNFIWKYGILRWGVFMFVCMTGFFHFALPDPNLVVILVPSLFIWALAGYCFGAAAWYMQEKKYG
jgi:hypothetical protein